VGFGERKFSSIVSARKPFGLSTSFKVNPVKNNDIIVLYTNKEIASISRAEIVSNKDWVDKYKVFISYAYGAGEDFPHQIINKPILGLPNSACTETYLVIGPFINQSTAENAMSYMRSKFFRFMVLLLKNSQHATSKVYSIAPLQDFSKPWTDAELYAKYSLSDDEIAFIESMIKPME
jgi:site-specific DNA-methyltransferase (adenine-specific)